MSLAELSRASAAMLAREQGRSGAGRDEALAAICRRHRISRGTLGNLIRRRVKDVAASVRDKIVSAMIADLTTEIERLEHDRQMLLQMGISPRASDMDAANTAIAEARGAIQRMKAGR